MAQTKVLIVEDDPFVAAHLEKVLTERHYEVRVLSSSAAEGETRSCNCIVPDVVLIDYHLRGKKTSIRVADHLRKEFDAPVIYLTSYLDETLVKSARSTDPFGFLVKPVNPKELFSCMDMTLNRHQTERKVKRLMQVLQAVRSVNQLIVREKDAQNLIENACQILVGTRGYNLVSIALPEKGNRSHPPLVITDENGGRVDPELSSWMQEALTGEPFQSAVDRLRPVICNDISDEIDRIPFYRSAFLKGFSAVAVIPMTYADRLFGLVIVVSNQCGIFDEEESDLLAELAGDIAFALYGIEEDAIRKVMEKSLRESEERYRRVIDTTSEGVWVLNKDVRTSYVNPRLADMLGYEIDELFKNPVEQFLYPEDLQDHRQRMEARRQGKVERYERRFRKKDGGTLWVLVSASPIFDAHGNFAGSLGMFTDISELKQANEALNNRFNELSVIYENSLMLTRIMPPAEIGKRIIDLISSKWNWNHMAVRLLNQTTGELELVAFSHTSLADEEMNREVIRLNNLIKRPGDGISGWVVQNGKSVCNGDVTQDPRYIGAYPGIKSGLYVPIRIGEATIGCITVESTKENAFGENEERLLSTLAHQVGISITNYRLYQAVRDELTERLKAEEALKMINDELELRVAERTEELRLANVALEKASHMKDEFLASMSHELRTPLTGVLNISEILQEQIYGPLNEKQIQLTKTIEASGRHLLALINDILDLSKIEAGELELRPELCSLKELCQSSLEMVKGMAQKKNILIKFEVPLEPFQLIVDPRRFKQMLVNLLSNAIKFTPDGGKVGLSVEMDAAAREARFTVWDTGIGISSSDIPRLFRPFSQLDSSLSRQQPGTGLGLALVKRMADMHGGNVSVQSVLGEGSRFSVSIPWQDANKAETGQPEPSREILQPIRPVSSNGSGPTILIADDNEVNLETYADYLSSKGFRVITARSGEEAVSVAQEQHPDLILMDIQMPRLDGLQAIQLIRACGDQKLTQVPILALTALAMSGDEERCLKAGADGYLSKPVSLKELVLSVQKYVKKSGF